MCIRDRIKALVAALQSQQVKYFMDENYKGAVVSVVENPTDGYDSSIDYDALNGETVSCLLGSRMLRIYPVIFFP